MKIEPHSIRVVASRRQPTTISISFPASYNDARAAAEARCDACIAARRNANCDRSASACSSCVQHEPSFEARWRNALRELERLHVEELARLLAAAAQLRARQLAEAGAVEFAPTRRQANSDSGELSVESAAEVSSALAREVAAWRLSLSDEVAAGDADGAQRSAALEALLAACGAPLGDSWPSVVQLASAAAALAPVWQGRSVVSRCQFERGVRSPVARSRAGALPPAVAHAESGAAGPHDAPRDARACG